MFRMLRRIGIFGCPPQLSKVVKNRSQIKTGDIEMDREILDNLVMDNYKKIISEAKSLLYKYTPNNND